MKHALLTILQLLVVFTPARSAGLLSDLGISSVGDGEDLVLASGGNRRSAPSALQRTRVLEHRDFQRNLTSTSLNLQTAPLGKHPRRPDFQDVLRGLTNRINQHLQRCKRGQRSDVLRQGETE